jgi:opacity protein-like surface antigen
MRKYISVAALLAAAASPAAARDASGYLGLEGGVLLPQKTDVDGKVTSSGTTIVQANDIFGIKYDTGYDVDLIGGYDLGMFRLEGELGYKRSSLDRLTLSDATKAAISDYAGVTITNSDLEVDGRTQALSGMLNALVDFGSPQFGAYAGGGAGLANVKFSGGGAHQSDSAMAWQLLAGVYTAISPNIDAGLKYRYFHTGRLKFSEDVAVDGTLYTGQLSGRFTSHSLLASLVYNFGTAYAAPPPPPPPPPPAPMALPEWGPPTAAPPPPPPPPPAPTQRGQRG